VRRKLLAFCLCAMPGALYGQSAMQTFTSPGSVFEFRYSPNLIHCSQEKSAWVPADACSAREQVCEGESGLSRTVACFAYPKDKFAEKPGFGAAVFFVAEVQEAASEQPCLDGDEWLPDSSENAEINGVRFKVFHTGDAWTNGSRSADLYRTFHDKTCYELGLQQVRESPVGLNPGTFKEFTKQDEQMVQRLLTQVLKSFRFLK
jgi:hypothetical protein